MIKRIEGKIPLELHKEASKLKGFNGTLCFNDILIKALEEYVENHRQEKKR